MQKPSLRMKDKTTEQNVANHTQRPKNPSANVLPSEGYVLEIDGKFKSEYETSEEALKAGLELKNKYPYIQVIVYGAKERTRTPIKLPEQLKREIEVAL